MIETTMEIFSSNTQTVSVYDSTTGKTVTTPTVTLNYRDRNTTSTSLILHGDGAFNYGQDLLTNLVRLTENFCYTEPPANPIIGQKYYNSITKTLHVFDDGFWNEIIITENKDPLDIVYESNITSNHGTYTLPSFLETLIPSSGNVTPVPVTLSGTEITLNNEAVSKKYVDSVLLAPTPYIPRTGYVEMQGPLTLADTLRSGDDDTLVNIKYVNELGTIDTVNDNTTVTTYRLTTYRDVDRVDDNGAAITSPWFTTAWIHGTIADSASDVTIELPITFVTATPSTANYTYSAIAVCTSMGSNVKLNVSFVDGSHIKVKRAGTTGELIFCGNVYGFRARA